MRSSSVAAPPTETQCASRRQPKSDGSSAASVTWPNATTTLTLRTRRFGSDGLAASDDAEPEGELEIDEDFLRRIREV